MMDGPWLGLGIMIVMIVGLVAWCVWAMRGKKDGD
jgi:hypothetical protein